MHNLSQRGLYAWIL